MGRLWTAPLKLATGVVRWTKVQPLVGPTPVRPLEGSLKLPKKWHQLILARRDFPSGSFEIPELDTTIVPSFLEAVAEAHGALFDQIVARSDEYRDSLASFRKGPTALEDPVAAALWWYLTVNTIDSSLIDPLRPHVIDWWFDRTEGGFVFDVLFALDDLSWEPVGEVAWADLNGFANSGCAFTILPATTKRGPSFVDRYRLRQHLAATDDASYEAARDRMAEELNADLIESAIFMFPAEQDWLDDYLAGVPDRGDIIATGLTMKVGGMAATSMTRRFRGLTGVVATSITTRAQLDLYCSKARRPVRSLGAKELGDALPSLLEAFGAELTPWLRHCITHREAEEWPISVIKDMVRALTIIGTDQAMAALVATSDSKHVSSALHKHADKHPAQAARAIVAALAGDFVAEPAPLERLLQRLVTSHEAAADAAGGSVVATSAAASLASEREVASELPRLLVDPPWKNRKPYEPRVIENVAVIEIDPIVTWIEGGSPDTAPISQNKVAPLAPSELKLLREQCEQWRWWSWQYFRYPPVDELRTWLDEHWSPEGLVSYGAVSCARTLFSRLEMDALPYMQDLLRCHPKQMRELWDCVGLVDDAADNADKFHRLKAQRRRGKGWLLRFPRHAIYGLIPHAVGADKPARAAAVAALRLLTERESELVAEISAEYGDDVAEVVSEELAISPLELLPKRMPKLPDFLVLEAMSLPQVADRSGTLTVEATRNLLLMMAIGAADDPYPGVELVLGDLDPESTQKFMWEAFVAWQDAGFPAKHSWILLGVGMAGGDDAVRRIAPRVRKWPHEQAAKRAQVGLDALGMMGSSLAMMELFTLSRKAKTKGLKSHAAMRVQNIADRLGLSEQQLQDRLIPDLGLDESGTRAFDYGERMFTVGFDESLVPFVRDADGKPYKSLPRKTKADDDEKVKSAKSEFTAIKREAKAVAADQLRRFEVAMTAGRRWTYNEFREFFADHPLMRHLAGRLVWGVYDNSLIASFRLAEDGTLADVVDGEVAVADDAIVGVAHPIELSAAERGGWGELLGDYELLQPFDQIARPVYEFSEAERAETSLDRFVGREASVGRYLGLRSRGWTVNPYGGLSRPATTHDGRKVFVHLSVGGLDMAYLDAKAIEITRGIWVDTSEGRTSPGRANALPLGDLDPIATSELIRDLEHLFR